MTAPVRVGVWLATGTATSAPYPCRCPFTDEWSHRNGRCPCWGRLDLAAMPAGCCGWHWPTLGVLWRMAGGWVPDLAPYVPYLTRQYGGS